MTAGYNGDMIAKFMFTSNIKKVVNRMPYVSHMHFQSVHRCFCLCC